MTELYYEAHVTAEPSVYPGDRETFETVCRKHRFRPAKLLMQKRDETPERSANDAFATARSRDLGELEQRIKDLVEALAGAMIQVWRYKIEETLVDSDYEDTMGLFQG